MKPSLVGTALVAVLTLGVCGGWAARTVWREAATAPATLAPEFIVYRASLGEIDRVLSYNVEVHWTQADAIASAVDGRLTELFVGGTEPSDEGDVIASVDLRPIVVARGSIPPFRELALGSSGADVTQLQSFLLRHGAAISDELGSFRSSTRSAVRSWQRSLGVADDGVVRPGDIAFVQDLPGALSVPPGLEVGDYVTNTTPLAVRWATPPTMSIAVDQQQATQLPERTAVRLPVSGGVVEGTLGARVLDSETGVIRIAVDPNDSGFCRQGCSELDLGVPTMVAASLDVVPLTTGVVVPVAAVWSDVEGQPIVTLASGERRRVSVIASAGGLAVVDGIEPGVDVRVPTTA